MLQRDFSTALHILGNIEQSDLEACGVIGHGDTGAWVDFTRDPHGWLLRASPLRAERLWNLILSQMAVQSFGDEAADALAEIIHLLHDFGMPASERPYAWLKARLEATAPVRRPMPLENL